VILLVDEGKSHEEIISFTDFGRRHAFLLKRNYLEEGIESLVDKRKGKPKELLTKKQREEILETIKTKTPKNVGYVYEFWTTSVLGEWIERKYKVRYKSKTSYQIIFRKAEFTYHKPGRVYHEQNKEEVEKWKKSIKPRLKKLWKEKNAVILCGDEMILTTRTTIQKIWLPKGEYPKIEVSNRTVQRRNVYGFLNIKTGYHHAWKTEKQNMHVTREILKKALPETKNRPVLG
jgi:transposase